MIDAGQTKVIRLRLSRVLPTRGAKPFGKQFEKCLQTASRSREFFFSFFFLHKAFRRHRVSEDAANVMTRQALAVHAVEPQAVFLLRW